MPGGVDASGAIAGYTGVALTIVLCGWCRFQVNRRRFRRRTIAGAQRFNSYGSAVATQLWEGLLMSFATAFMGIAVLCGIALTVALYWPH